VSCHSEQREESAVYDHLCREKQIPPCGRNDAAARLNSLRIAVTIPLSIQVTHTQQLAYVILNLIQDPYVGAMDAGSSPA